MPASTTDAPKLAPTEGDHAAPWLAATHEGKRPFAFVVVLQVAFISVLSQTHNSFYCVSFIGIPTVGGVQL